MRIFVSTVPFAEADPRPIENLREIGAEITINPLDRKLKDVDLAELIPGYDVLIAGTEQINEKVLAQADSLKLIARVGIGLDSVDLNAARRRGIEVTYTPDAPSPAVGELTIGLMISLLRSVHVSNLRMHQGEWNRFFGKRLSEVCIGLIGIGRIGSRVLRHLSAFNCRRILVNDILTELQLADSFNGAVRRVEKDEIYRQADIISIHVPLTQETRNLISKSEIEKMKPGVLLVNTSRGGIINEADLGRGLKGGRVGAAAIDVFDQEPYVGSLSEYDNCLLTAHMGSMSVDCRTQMELEATQEAIRLFKKEDLANPVPEFEYEVQRASRGSE